MYFFVTVATAVGRQLNHIAARDRDGAARKVKGYNARYPAWKMKLLKRRGTRTQSRLETRLFRRK